ncbi:MAG: hypothetical protein AMXMBFR4_31070 [Candidatus Hydrogenedentota bacterium]
MLAQVHASGLTDADLRAEPALFDHVLQFVAQFASAAARATDAFARFAPVGANKNYLPMRQRMRLHGH